MDFTANRRKIFVEEFTNLKAICVSYFIIYYRLHLILTQYFVSNFPSFSMIVFIFIEDTFEVLLF